MSRLKSCTLVSDMSFFLYYKRLIAAFLLANKFMFGFVKKLGFIFPIRIFHVIFIMRNKFLLEK